MAHPERSEATPAPMPSMPDIAGRAGYRPGGQVGLMQADLARRLAGGSILSETPAVPAGERMVRFVSVAGGSLALVAAYAGLVALILR